MEVNKFFTTYNGKPIDFDKNKKYWCVDVFRQYCVDVLGISGWIIPAVSYAKQLFTDFPDNGNKYFVKIYNTPYNVPQKGDVIIWGVYPLVTGFSGHVAICYDANILNLVSFEQNYPTGSLCHFQKHSYKGVLGWLRLKL